MSKLMIGMKGARLLDRLTVALVGCGSSHIERAEVTPRRQRVVAGGSRLLNKPGSCTDCCQFHAFMHGTVIVSQ